jgi:hypothetical protein
MAGIATAGADVAVKWTVEGAKYTQEVNILKPAPGSRWTIHTVQHWGGDTPPVHTYAGASTLAWAIFITVDWCATTFTRITSFTVKGRAVTLAEVESAINKSTAGRLSYASARCLAVARAIDGIK